MTAPEWFDEQLYAGSPEVGYSQRLQVERTVFRRRTEFQDVAIFQNPKFGKVLALDGVVQTTEGDEFCYHEMMVHVPLFAHGRAERVLIIGGGDGGILREVLRHPVKKAVMVEIDGAVVDICREYMPSLSAGAFDDPRTELVIADGLRYVADEGASFDVVIIDSTDPTGPGEVLFTEAFYADCKRRMTGGGILVNQNGAPFLQGGEVADTHARRARHFADVGFYLTVVPTYVGGFMALGWATDDKTLRHIREDVLAERFKAAGFGTRYYTPAIHGGAFALPPFIADLTRD